MILLLLFIFWLTIQFSNYPSSFLFSLFAKLEEKLLLWFQQMHAPPFLTGILISRCVQSIDMGDFCDASAHGDFFPAFYVFGGFGVFAESGI